jgi:uncharacterized protein YjeT (DUF2065 family)
MWDDLLRALGLMLVLEGILPFLNPQGLRQALAQFSRLDNRLLRLTGLGSMLIGVLLLYFIR